jgi:hypothetical protein
VAASSSAAERCLTNGILDGSSGGAGEFDEFIDVVFHVRFCRLGEWTSKLGNWEDIEHKTLAALEGEFYGKVVQILKRAAT